MATAGQILLEGCTATETPEGWEFHATMPVVGVTGTDMQQLVNAVHAAGVPTLGSRLAGWPSAVLVSRTPEPLGDGKFMVALVYKDQGELDDPADQTIEVSTSLRSELTNRNLDGSLIVVEYGGKKQSGEVAIDTPASTMRVHRTESDNPQYKSAYYTGSINSTAFALAHPHMNAPGSWRCNSIVGSSSDRGRSWEVDYEFEYDVAGWEEEVSYLDPETGRIPDAVIDGSAAVQADAIVTVKKYEALDFNALGLT